MIRRESASHAKRPTPAFHVPRTDSPGAILRKAARLVGMRILPPRRAFRPWRWRNEHKNPGMPLLRPAGFDADCPLHAIPIFGTTGANTDLGSLGAGFVEALERAGNRCPT